MYNCVIDPEKKENNLLSFIWLTHGNDYSKLDHFVPLMREKIVLKDLWKKPLPSTSGSMVFSPAEKILVQIGGKRSQDVTAESKSGLKFGSGTYERPDKNIKIDSDSKVTIVQIGKNVGSKVNMPTSTQSRKL